MLPSSTSVGPSTGPLWWPLTRPLPCHPRRCRRPPSLPPVQLATVVESLSQSQAFAAAFVSTVLAMPASAATDLEDVLMAPQAENTGDR